MKSDPVESLMCTIGGSILGFTIGMLTFLDSGKPELQKQAIYYNYGSYAKNGDFVWKAKTEEDNFLKDLEFFKRNEKMFRQPDSNDMIPLPKTEDLFN